VTARAALIYPAPQGKTEGVELRRDARLPFPWEVPPYSGRGVLACGPEGTNGRPSKRAKI
jgi:hypothetical protein